MKKNNNTTPRLAEKLRRALHHVFQCRSCDPKYDAQENIRPTGSHWADDGTLKYFGARISDTHDFANGTLFLVRSTVQAPADMPRFYVTVFDLLGTVVIDVKEHTRKAADKEADAQLETFDARAHYRQASKERAQRLRSEAAELTHATR